MCVCVCVVVVVVTMQTTVYLKASWFLHTIILNFLKHFTSASIEKHAPKSPILQVTNKEGKKNHILLSIPNKMQRYAIFFVTVNVLHVSGGFSAHHQELEDCTHSIWYMPSLLAATASGSSKRASKQVLIKPEFPRQCSKNSKQASRF